MFGLFISSLCADEVSAAMLGMGSFFPTIMLGGIFWPVCNLTIYQKATPNHSFLDADSINARLDVQLGGLLASNVTCRVNALYPFPRLGNGLL